MKLNFIAAAALLSSAAFGAEIIMNGGKIVPVRSSTVETFTDDLNFCFATNYSDGQIHMNHSKGVHTLSEYPCADISYDNGKTWHSGKGKSVLGYTAWETPDGEKMSIGCWERNMKKEHSIVINRIDKNGNYSKTHTTISMPYESSFQMHRDVIRLKDNTLLATAYGVIKGAKKSHCFVIKSTDEGKTWQHLSILADDPEGKTPDGPGEAAICQLADGSIMGVWRDGGTMKYAYSRDNGKTWGERGEYKGLPMAVAPHMRLLKNGTLVIVTGRPYTHLLVDFTGTGKNFQLMDIYKGAGSSYGSVLEIEPNRILVVHDESSFVGIKAATPFSRIVADVYDVVKDDSIRKGSGDPRSAGFDVFYSAYDKKTPHEAIKAMFFEYVDKKNNPKVQGPAWFDIVQTPERPEPILRIVSRGDNSIKHGSEWATFRYMTVPSDVRKMTVEFEVRIMDNDTDKAQIMFNGYIADPDNPAASLTGAQVKLGKDFVQFGSKTVMKELIRGTFVAFELKLDAAAKKAWLYKKGSSTPLGEVNLVSNKGNAAVWWGDGSGTIFGTADLSYIGLKYNK